jgi:hypothetical protein
VVVFLIRRLKNVEETTGQTEHKKEKIDNGKNGMVPRVEVGGASDY